MTASGARARTIRPSLYLRLAAVAAAALALGTGQDVSAAAAPQRARARHPAKPRAIATAAPSLRRPRRIKRRGLKDGWKLPICHVPADRRRPVSCTNVGTISRQSPEIAIRLAEAVNRAAEARRGPRSGRLSANDILGGLTQDPALLGCAGKGRHQGAVYLAGQAARLRPRSRPGARGLDKEVTSACSEPDATNRDGLSIGTAVTDWRATAEAERTFYNDWLREANHCAGERSTGGRGGDQSGNTMMQGGSDDGAGGGSGTNGASGASGAGGVAPAPTTAKVLIGKAWRAVTKVVGAEKKWKSDTRNAAIGQRGYCFFDDDCANTCEANAMARSLAQELQATAYAGCNDNVTPAPGSTDTCYNVLQKKKITEAMRRQLWEEACAATGGVKQPCDDPDICSVRCADPKDLAKGERAWGACGLPEAMCGPDQVGGWPGGDPPEPEKGPRPFPQR